MGGLSGSERTKLWKLRKAGKVAPAPSCKSCGKQLKVGCGNGQAQALGLCYSCFKKTSEGRKQHRRSNMSRARREGEEVWAVGYWAQKPDSEEKPVKFSRLREAIGFSSGGRGNPSGPVFVAWCDARVTEHYGLKFSTCKGLTPDHETAHEAPVDDPGWFLDQVPASRRAWFEVEG